MVHTRVFLFVLSSSLMPVAISAQQAAYIYCDPKADSMGSVLVYDFPYSTQVTHGVLCGQQVILLEINQAFAKIQTGDQIGYVKASYIRKQDTSNDVQRGDVEPASEAVPPRQGNTIPKNPAAPTVQTALPAAMAQSQPVTSISGSANVNHPTTSVDVSKAIARGFEFKSRLQYLDKGLKRNKVQLASAWATDGISKYVTFFTDFEIIASAAAQAKQEMRTFTTEDALKLPLTGLIYAHVEIHGRGMLPVRKVARRYVKNAAHLAIQYGEEIVQPLSKELQDVRDASFIAPVAVYTWWETNNVSLLTGGTLGYEGSKVELEFVFWLTPEQQKRKGKVILIDADGNRHQQDVDFSQIFGR